MEFLAALAAMAGTGYGIYEGATDKGGMEIEPTFNRKQQGLFNTTIRDVAGMVNKWQPSGLPKHPTHSASTRGVADKGRDLMGRVGQREASPHLAKAAQAMGGDKESLAMVVDKGYTSLLRKVLEAVNA